MQRSAAAERFRLIQQLQDRFPVLWLVKKLQVARSGYYSWLQRQSNPGKRAKQDDEIAADIEVVFKTHRSRYGSPRIHQELRGNGRHIGRKRVERLMKRQGIQALQRRRFRCCPKKEEGNKIATNILSRKFNPTEQNRYWCGDITPLYQQRSPLVSKKPGGATDEQ